MGDDGQERNAHQVASLLMSTWGRFELSLHRSSRSTTMFRGIAIALFGMGIFSQLDRAFFYGRNTDAVLKLAR